MKRTYLLCILFVFFRQVHSQHTGYGIIDTNNVAAGFSNNGNLFYPGGFIVPNPHGSTLAYPSAIFDANILVAGKNNGVLFCSSEEYNSQYQAGPIGTLPQDTGKWDYIWSISRSDILSVKNDFDVHHTITLPVPASVLTWPAKGNPNAAGQNGVSLTVTQDMAPFYDRNGDGIYNVYDGDYPKIRGDKMLWWINNDTGSHSQNPMGIDRRYSVYEYECTGDSNLDNTLFLSVSIKNQSTRSYDSLTIGVFADLQLGCANNDRIGCIPPENSFYVYKGFVPGGTQQNGVSCDEGYVCPISEVGYGCNLPILSATFLNDTMKCYEYFLNGAFAGMSDPSTDQGFYRYMNGEWNDGTPVTFGGNGYGGSTPYPFAFPGNPADTSQWSEATVLAAGDRRSIAAIGPFSLGVGDTISFDMAFIFHQDSFNNTPDISDSSIVNRHIDSIRTYYAAETFPCWFDSSKLLNPGFYNVGIQEITSGSVFSLVPNPNNGSFTIHLSAPFSSDCIISVTDMLGRIVYYNSLTQSPDQTIKLSNAANGVYSVTIESPSYKATKRVVVTSQ